ncbi:PKD-like family lipoprotein [uncultured Polaribacter sp.]|uniref:PKD-like family lipoprotein n=1 Tax=uncultured Polaribacter sp. TaxID=174711 RepID=UPI00260DF96B|nr:PKD-like family lipoprotein [uncultured Polaribacter sp.]
MKKSTLFALLCFGLMLTINLSCYEDNSTLDDNLISGVRIDTTGMSELTVRQFERLTLTPDLDIGNLSEADLSYEWRINLAPNTTEYDVISTEKNLDYEVRLPPNRTGRFHQLFYKVIDNITELEYSIAWPLTVLNNIGEGLVVAVTADGITTDISHIMSPEVSPDFNEVSVKQNVYSAINNNTIDGLIKDMIFTTIFGVDAMLMITDNSVVRINTLDYTFGGKNDDLFFGNLGTYQPQSLGVATSAVLYVGSNKFTATNLGISREFGIPFDFTFQVPAEIAVIRKANPPVIISFYDETNEHFVYQARIGSFGDRNMIRVPSAPTGVFNPDDVTNKTNVAAGVSTTGNFRHLLKDLTTNEMILYEFDGGIDEFPSPIAPAPLSITSLAGAPNIANAKHFVILEDQKVIYYATDTTIYAMLYSASTPTFETRYTVPAGEKITTLQVYQQAGYPYDQSTSYITTNNKQLIMSTYNGTEGKVSILPIINIGLGNIDTPNIKTFTGFDRVTAIGTQK